MLKVLQHVKVMIKLAEEDLAAAEDLIERKHPQRIIFFHIQQTVEKTLKAWLILLGFKPSKTHDLTMLYKNLSKRGATFARNFEYLCFLNPFAVKFRYREFTKLNGASQEYSTGTILFVIFIFMFTEVKLYSVQDLLSHVKTLVANMECTG